MSGTITSLMPQGFRLNTEILARFVATFYINRSLKKIYQHFVSKITWKLFLRCLDWLQNKNYAEYKNDGNEELYHLTESRSFITSFTRRCILRGMMIEELWGS